MAITSLDNYIASAKQRIGWTKTASITTVALIPFSNFDTAGNPGAGTLAGATVASAIVQDNTMAGYPAIDYTATAGTIYLSKVEYGNTVASRIYLYDIIAKSGAYGYATSTTAITSYPAITGRCPDFSTTTNPYGARNEIWIEVSTAFVTGTAWQVQCTYINQAGATSHSTIISAAQAAAALTKLKLFQLALAAGDTGVQAIQSVIVTNGGTAMTAGAFNVLIARCLYSNMRVPIANGGDIHDMLRTGLPVIYPTSALTFWVRADSTASGLPDAFIEICQG